MRCCQYCCYCRWALLSCSALAAGSLACPGLCYCCLPGRTADVRHCMVAGGSAVGSPLPHREVVNNLAKTLQVRDKEKLYHEQLFSGDKALIQVSRTFVIYWHLPTEQLNGPYTEKQQLPRRRHNYRRRWTQLGTTAASPGSRVYT